MGTTKRIRYVGPYPRVSVPGRPRQYVTKGETIEVPADMIVGATWETVTEAAAKTKAKTKEADDA